MSGGMYGSGSTVGQAIFTDDVSLQVFMEHLKRLVRIEAASIRIILIFIVKQAVGAQTN